MATPSFKQMAKDRTIRRADARKIRYEDLHVEPGFNLRRALHLLPQDEREAAEANDESLFQHIMRAGPLPPLEVRPREAGGVWIVEGHRRHQQIGRAIEAGAPLQDKNGEVLIDIVPFEGNDEDRLYRVFTSQNNRKLLPLEFADGYKRARGFGHTFERMAESSGQTVEFVKRMLKIGDSNNDVQRLVLAGKVSPTIAAQVASQHGENAGQVLAVELEKAQAAGKTKVTAGTMRKRLPAKLVDEMVEALEDLVDDFGYTSYISDDEKEADARIVKVRALLAKAKG